MAYTKQGNFNNAFIIDGTRSLVVYDAYGRKELESFALHKTEISEILSHRLNAVPTFVLKVEDCLYLADISYRIHLTKNLNAIEKEHLCNNCKACHPYPEQFGGCSKVRDCSIDAYEQIGNSFEDAVDLSKRIEKYPFITYGYETFGVKVEVLCVSQCINYKYLKNYR
ncbi:MAG: hypothetical protein IJ220_09085 [Clostridia bacterium]|nr:hypothetical protein [Clostridia bacterium]